MPSAETARLIASLELQDKFSAPLATADRKLAGFEQKANRTFKGIGRAGSHLGGTLKGLAGGVGFLGVSLGAAGLAGAFASVTSRSAEFAKESDNLATLMGTDIGTASALVDTLDDFGVTGDQIVTTLGRLNKNVGGLAGTTQKAKKFQDEYGFSLLDSQGKIADTNTLIQRSADFYTSNASATDKATVLQKLYGKSWTTLIPLLKEGGKGVKDYTDKSIHLTAEQAKQAGKFEAVRREFASTIDELKIMAGIDILPDVTEALRGGIKWLGEHKGEVRQAFKDGIQGAKEFAGFITGTVIPTLSGIADAAKKAWSGIPAPIKDLLVKGVVADRTIKFLFGVSPGEMLAKGLGGALASAIGGKLFQRGGSPASPLYVAPVGPGALGGVGGAAGGKLGKIGGALSLIPAIGLIALAIETGFDQNESTAKQANEIAQTQTDWLKTMPKREDLVNGLNGIDRGIADFKSNPFNVLVGGQALTELEGMRAAQLAALSKLDAINASVLATNNTRVTVIPFLKSERDEAPRPGLPSPRNPRTPTPSTPRVGIENNRPVYVQARVTSSDVTNANQRKTRIGPTIQR